MKHVYLSCIALALLSACQNDYKTLEHFGHLPTDTLAVSTYIDLEDYDILKPESVVKQGDVYYTKEMISQNLISRFSMTDSTVLHGVSRGQGPMDIISCQSFRLWDDTLTIFEPTKNRFHRILANDNQLFISPYRQLPIDSTGALLNAFLTRDGYITQGFVEDALLVAYDNQDALVSRIPYPSYSLLEPLSPSQKAMMFSGTNLVCSPDGKHIAIIAGPVGSYIFFGAMESGNVVREIKRWEYEEPVFGNDGDKGLIAYTKGETLIGFHDIACTDDYVYALYSGQTREEAGSLHKTSYCKHLLVYDWEGNPVRRYYLEKPLYANIEYDETTRTIYGVAYDPEGVLLEYTLPPH
jgi:hypothetical protein